MENQREHGKKDVAEKTSKEIIVNSLTELFADDEFGFDMFIMMKTGEPPMKHFAFYEGPTGREHDFKLKVQNSIVKSIRDLFLDEEAEYAMAEQAGGNQNIFYIIKQNDDYKPFELLNTPEKQMGPFFMDDRPMQYSSASEGAFTASGLTSIYFPPPFPIRKTSTFLPGY